MEKIYVDVKKFMTDISCFYDRICQPCSEERIQFFENVVKRYKIPSPHIIDTACSTGETCTLLAMLGYNIIYRNLLFQ